MISINDKLFELTPYEPIKEDFDIRLDANESCFDLPQDIKEKICTEIMDVSFNRYPDPLAEDLCGAFADYYGISSQNVTAGNGSDELISIIINAFLMKGEKVITTEPDFSMYRFYANLAEADIITLEKTADLDIDIDELIKVSNQENAKLILLSNPCNPTSKGILKEDVFRLLESVKAFVVLDEAYMDFWDQSLLKEAANFDNLIILRTASKAVGGAALRLGFAVAGKSLTKVLRTVKSPYNVNSLSQAAGTVLFSEHEYLEHCKKTIVALRRSLQSDLTALAKKNQMKITVIEGQCNFVFIKTSLAKVIHGYLQNSGISVKLMGDYLRITAGTTQENKELLTALKDFFK